MLYTKSIYEITWEDVQNFCEQKIPEGATLDYKGDFPTHLYRTIAAFANTIGGLILIGIESDDENKPKLPIKGIKFERGLEERVTSIILTNITPPIFPEIVVCKNEEGDKAIILIRINQSHQTPHAINNNTQVYLRTGNQNHPEELAKIDDIFWLNDHRKNAEDLRDKLLYEAVNRFERIYQSEMQKSTKKNEQTLVKPECWLEISLCPLFPKDVLISPPKLPEILLKMIVRDFYGTSDNFPIDNRLNRRIAQNGMILYTIWAPNCNYTELNIFGLYYYRQNLLGRFEPGKKEQDKIIRLYEILARLDEFIDSAIKFYNNLNFSGSLRFQFSIKNLTTYKLIAEETEFTTFEEKVEHIIDLLTNNDLEKNKDIIIYDSVSKLLWAYNSHRKEENISTIINRLKS